MIDFISNWAGELTVSLIIVTIIEMLLPESKLKKYVNTVIGLYIIFCIISPFVNKKAFATILEEAEKNLEKMNIENQVTNLNNGENSIEALYIQEFEKDVIKKVEEQGYNVEKCNVNIEIDATKENAGICKIYLEISETQNNNLSTNIEIEDIEKVEISINEKEEVNNTINKETEEIKKLRENLSNYYEISEDKIKIIQK